MRRLLVVSSIGLSALSAGCASAPIVLDQPPPSEPMAEPNGLAEVVVLREGIMAFAVTFGVYIDDLHVGVLHTDDVVHHFVEPGEVKMFVGAENRSPARFPVEANRVYYFRAIPTMGWWFARVQLEVIADPAEGRAIRARSADKTFEQPVPFVFELDI